MNSTKTWIHVHVADVTRLPRYKVVELCSSRIQSIIDSCIQAGSYDCAQAMVRGTSIYLPEIVRQPGFLIHFLLTDAMLGISDVATRRNDCCRP